MTFSIKAFFAATTLALTDTSPGLIRPSPDPELRVAQVTVGAAGSHIAGWDHIAVQAAIDYAANRGFREVRLTAGIYSFRSSVYIPSGIKVIGAGESTVIRPTAAARSAITANSEWYKSSIEVEDADAFSVGDSINIACTSPNLGWELERRVVSKHDKTLLLDAPLGQNLFLKHNPQCSNLHSMFVVLQSTDVELRDFRIDGDVGITETLNGNFGAAVFLSKSRRVTLSGVSVHRFNGDAFSIQESHEVTLNNCDALRNASSGLHIGSGSQQLTCSRGRLMLNNIGVFFCWGVEHASLTQVTVSGSRNEGVSVGHLCDSISLSSCLINSNGGAGLHVRKDSIGGEDCPTNLVVLRNAFSDNGGRGGQGERSQAPELQFDCATRGLKISGNLFLTTAQSGIRSAVRINMDHDFFPIEIQHRNFFLGFDKVLMPPLAPRQP
jgi:hypothetical protein